MSGYHTHRDRVSVGAAALCAAAAAVLLVSYVGYVLTSEPYGALLVPGRFLHRSFHVAGLLVPLYLVAGTVVLFRGDRRSQTLFALNVSLLPFLAAGVTARLVFGAELEASPVTRSAVAVFGIEDATTVFSLLTAILALTAVLMVRLWIQESRQSDSSSRSARQGIDGLALPEPDAAGAREGVDAPAKSSGALFGDDPEEEIESLVEESVELNARSERRNGDDAEDEGIEPSWADALLPVWRRRHARVRFDDAPPQLAPSVVSGEPQELEEPEELDEADEALPVEPEESHEAERAPVAAGSPGDGEQAGRTADGVKQNGEPRGGETRLVWHNGAFFRDHSTAATDSDRVPDLAEADGEAGDADRAGRGANTDFAYYTDREGPGRRRRHAEEIELADDDDADDPVDAVDAVDARDFADTGGIEDTGSLVDTSAVDQVAGNNGAAGSNRNGRYEVPVKPLLAEYRHGEYWKIDQATHDASETLRVTLAEFGIEAEVTGIRKGPVITMFEILPAPGVKLAKIVNLADNIALRLAAQSVRIVAPIPGKHAVGIEVPNQHRAVVGFAELVRESGFTTEKHQIPVALGKDIPGDAQIIDLTKTPHLLIAGATGSGKSVCVNSIICSMLYSRSPSEVKMILIDPKIVELKLYNDIPHLLTPVITDPKRAFQALQYCVYEMERRYQLLDALGVRDIDSYNDKLQRKRIAAEPLPYLVVVVDEFADLMATSGKELESTVARLAAMSRAVGIHLVLATQRPSTDVITGLIKANIPSRIAFMVAGKVDSRIILESQGAEKLLGRGDMLFTSAWDPFPKRMQGAFLSEEELERVVDHVRSLGEPEYIDDEIFVDEDDDDDFSDYLEDPLMEKAIEVVVGARKASASYLQRRLKVGYNRAARMIEEMERQGIVGPQNGSKPREILAGSE